jgi:uncharacterized protein (UPF0332 family)
MENKQLAWCFGLKGGLKMAEPNERLSKSYFEQAKSSILRAEKDFKDNDLLWATVAVYYSEYYALYAFLQRIGVKCENHACSIVAAGTLLGEEKIKVINEHKSKRIDAQYYMKVEKEQEVQKMLVEAKGFIAFFDEILSKLTAKDIAGYRSTLDRQKSGKN